MKIKRIIISLGLGYLLIFVGLTRFAYADDPVSYMGCLSTGAGVIYNAQEGATPLHACASGDPQVAGGGDITSVTAGTGLTGGGTSGDVSLSLLDGGVTTVKIASSSVTTAKIDDGAVTPDKISNDASEPSRIQTWVDETTDNSFAATSYGHNTIASDISITVPEGKAYYYIVTYDGEIGYNYSERVGSNSTFYAGWSARLLADSTPVSQNTLIVSTGQSESWAALGNSSVWREPYHATWPIRLTGGTYTLGLDVNGYSANTMNYAHFQYNHLQVLRVF